MTFETELDRGGDEPILVEVEAHFFDGQVDELAVYEQATGKLVTLTTEEEQSIVSLAEKEREKWALEPDDLQPNEIGDLDR